jgi:GxxExxY protein
MNADSSPDLQAGRSDAYPCADEAHAVIGCAFEVLNELGHGLNEKLYENAMAIEFKRRAVSFDKQRRFEVLYKSEWVGEFIPDLIAFGKVIVDAKCIDRISDHERGQVLNYLRIANLPVGLILNFKHARLEFERIVLSAAGRPTGQTKP